jgi:hypothetical protein
MISALYGIVARRITVVDGVETEELVRCNSVFDLTELAPLMDEYAAAYADAADIRIDLDTTPTA